MNRQDAKVAKKEYWNRQGAKTPRDIIENDVIGSHTSILGVLAPWRFNPGLHGVLAVQKNRVGLTHESFP
ncbi:MAG: hypothetical protein HY941_06560 [Gammaproteobacteria bacterium]|nr:hypothetical protein [Gammaproteobacteria bacterium]